MTNEIRKTKRAIYCQVKDLLAITNLESFQERFRLIQEQYAAEKIYLEVYRHGRTLEASRFEALAAFFRQEGLEVATGLTTDEPEHNDGGFDTLCYTDDESRKIIQQAVRTAASHTNELLIDDFLFTNCRCQNCIQVKGKQSWSEFRVKLMSEILEDIILPTAKSSNAQVEVILKFPNWYQGYNSLGYSLANAEANGLSLYAGAETRNPIYTQQHLPKYLSYFICRLLDNAGTKLHGAWIDPYETTGNWTWFAEQIELALLAKSDEITLFSLGDLLEAQYKLAFPIAGEVIRSSDLYLSSLGKPSGLASYLPEGGQGEDYLHGFIGSVGIPLEPRTIWPEHEPSILLTKSSAVDPAILARMQTGLLDGKDIILTSGFLESVQGDDFDVLFAHIEVTRSRLQSQRFAYSVDGGITFAGVSESATLFSFPKISYKNNDSWELVAALGAETSCPLLLKLEYGRGNLYVWTMPDDLGQLADLPPKVLNPIRAVLALNEAPVILRGPGKILLFTYDNDCIVLHSLLPWFDSVTLEIRHGYDSLLDLESGEYLRSELIAGKHELRLSLRAGVTRVFKLKNGSNDHPRNSVLI